MRSPLATIACACLLLGGCSKSAEDSANPLLGKDAECLELFARSNALYCDIREDERESQAKGTPRRHTDYEVADAAYLLKATGGALRDRYDLCHGVFGEGRAVAAEGPRQGGEALVAAPALSAGASPTPPVRRAARGCRLRRRPGATSRDSESPLAGPAASAAGGCPGRG